MNIPDFEFKWIGQVDVPGYDHNLWGIFSIKLPETHRTYKPKQQFYFQCKSMKSIVISSPSPWYYAKQDMISRKKDRKYVEVSFADLLVKWPEFLNELTSSYIHFKLSNID